MQSAFRVLECVAPRSWIDGPSLVRFVMGSKGKITTAEAMWAIHEIARAGGFIVHFHEQALPPISIVTADKPPAGIQMAEGILHVDGISPIWSNLDFEPQHQRIDEIRRSLTLTGLPNAAMPSRADRSPLFPRGVPHNHDIQDLATKIDSEKNLGKSMNEIAREFTREPKGSDRKARSLLRQIRRMRHDGKINL
jgi:hypothetical protein